MNNCKPLTRWALGIGACLAIASVPGHGVAGSGAIGIWLDDATNTTAPLSFCEAVTSDQNGGGNGNDGQSTVTNDTNGDGNGNNGQGSRQICLFGIGGGGSGGGGSDTGSATTTTTSTGGSGGSGGGGKKK